MLIHITGMNPNHTESETVDPSKPHTLFLGGLKRSKTDVKWENTPGQEGQCMCRRLQ